MIKRSKRNKLDKGIRMKTEQLLINKRGEKKYLPAIFF